VSADWTAPKLRHATILIKTDPVSWCDATRRDAMRRGTARHESTFTAILDIQRLFFFREYTLKKENPQDEQWRLFDELISFSHLIKRIRIELYKCILRILILP